MTTPSRDPVTTAHGLTAALTAMEQRLREAIEAARSASEERDQTLATYGKRNRRYIAVDVALTVLLAVFGFVSVQAASQASKATESAAAQHASLVSACQSANQTRVEQVQLWTHLYDQALTSRHLTAKQKADDERLIAYIHHVFAEKDCRAVYATSGPGK